MGWLRRSARENVLKDLHLGKKGRAGGLFSRGEQQQRSYSSLGSSQSYDGGRKGSPIMAILMVAVLLVASVAGFGYIQSEAGQRSWEAFKAGFSAYTIDPFSDFWASVYDFGGGEYFTTTTNSSSSKQGVDLADLAPITGQTVPAGSNMDFQYDFEFYNVKSGETFPNVDFDCYMNVTEKMEGEDISCQEDGECGGVYSCQSRECVLEYTIYGDIIPETPTTIAQGSTVLCRINGEDTETLDGAYSVYGKYSLPYETEDATLNVYFITESVNTQLAYDDEDFFSAYDLDVSSSDLRVVYNGEPIAVGIGVGEEGKEGQPVVVGEGDSYIYNTIGITLENKWGGTIAELVSMILTLPDGITLDDSLNGEPSVTCPFVAYESGREGNVYVMDDFAADQLFTYYIQENAFFGTDDSATFQCWLDIEESFVGSAGYVVDQYVADASYVYTVKPETAQVSIKGTGEGLVNTEDST